MQQVVRDYYQNYQMDGLAKIIADYDLSLPLFYHYLDSFYLKVALAPNLLDSKQNQTGRNSNILKQFIFLNNYHIVSYFYHRLSNNLANFTINYHYDNLLIASLFPEVTSMRVFNANFASYGADLIASFIKNHKMIVAELIMILEYKLDHETLLVTQSEIEGHPLLIKGTTYTVRQALAAINRLNFLEQLGPLKVIAFQAGYLTYDQTKSVVLADVDANKYGKLTRYDVPEQEFY